MIAKLPPVTRPHRTPFGGYLSGRMARSVASG
jgi:hypothetical protein